MREGAIGFGHLVGVFALLDRVAAVVGGVENLAERRPVMVGSLRPRAAVMIQRIASARERSVRTSTGT